MPKFALTDVVAKFTMKPMIEEPLDELLDAIDEQISMAISEAEKLNGRKVDGLFYIQKILIKDNLFLKNNFLKLYLH